jgi:hypothetical protein
LSDALQPEPMQEIDRRGGEPQAFDGEAGNGISRLARRRNGNRP